MDDFVRWPDLAPFFRAGYTLQLHTGRIMVLTTVQLAKYCTAAMCSQRRQKQRAHCFLMRLC